MADSDRQKACRHMALRECAKVLSQINHGNGIGFDIYQNKYVTEQEKQWIRLEIDKITDRLYRRAENQFYRSMLGS